ncbi:unnamed protein product [Moneuplotes crassus]|uniref:GAR domain-containing protein n=2 Tax=Euplotes crassus TaxID=5936 RepID=A0AAD2D793_EUPCR|nr:unnamed protein product [Moneuplotes crassus]
MSKTVLLFNVTDIELEEDAANYNTNRPNIIAYISIDNQLIDAVWRNRIEIPISPINQILQIVLRENNEEQRKLGSLSIRVEQFLELQAKKTYSHWVTLFDYIEDDEYDGDLGIDDDEKPRAYIRYGLENAITESKKPKAFTTHVRKAKEDRKGSSKIVTTTKTTTYSISSASRFKQQNQEELHAPEPVPERQVIIQQEAPPQQTRQENIERYSVRILECDLKADTKELIHELQDQQNDVLKQQEYRMKTLSNLDKLHRELTGEHIQDQVSYFKLQRNEKDILLDYEVRKAAVGEHIKVLNSQIENVDLETHQTQNEYQQRSKTNSLLENEVNKAEYADSGGLSQEAKDLRKENNSLRNNTSTLDSNLNNERNNTNDLKSKHDQAIKAYNDTLEKYNDLLLKAEESKKLADSQRNGVLSDISKENLVDISLSKKKALTNQSVSSLSELALKLKSQLSNLDHKYNEFMDKLTKVTQEQEREVEDLQNQLSKNGESAHDLSNNLKNQTKEIEELHKELDQENASNLNGKLRKIIDELLLADNKRKDIQDCLENAQSTWRAKLQLFTDEASRRSREDAREKRIHEIEKHISKIDQLTREIYSLENEADCIQTKIFTDTHRDILEEELRRELDSVKLKARWAEDERAHSYEELQALLQTLREVDIREMQESEISELRTEVDEVRIILTEKAQQIRELETEVTICVTKIEEITYLIELKNQEIRELNIILEEKNRIIKNLNKQLGKATKANYAAARGDAVDKMLAEYLNQFGTRVPIKRLGKGFYLFGTKKIYAKIMNGRLVVRVGGGYMVIDEFVATYEEPELTKLYKLAEREGLDNINDLDIEAITGIYAEGAKSPGGRSPGGRSPKGAKGKKSPGKSPKGQSFRTKASSSINGTQRSPRISAATLKNARKI